MTSEKDKFKKFALCGIICCYKPTDDQLEIEILKKYGYMYESVIYCGWKWMKRNLINAPMEDLLKIITILAPEEAYNLAVKISEL